jgi:hypothetical protein
MGVLILVVYLAFLVLMIASIWTIFTKSGKPGWAAIVPIYNIIVMLEIAKKPTWWILLFLVPVANIVVGIMMWNEIAKSFGRTSAFTVGLILLMPVFLPMLAFGSGDPQLMREYQGNDALLDN